MEDRGKANGESHVAPNNHDRIQRLRHEFQQALQEEEPEDQHHTCNPEQPWVRARCSETQARHLQDIETQPPKKKQKPKEIA
ncbi:hypothetical protein CRUP_026690 [Coryphaenoides rupestris]|nr:hypothetical protein CRUP_026690 [Coryphaenoides rupestris]